MGDARVSEQGLLLAGFTADRSINSFRLSTGERYDGRRAGGKVLLKRRN